MDKKDSAKSGAKPKKRAKTPKQQTVLHPRNKHQGRYDFAALIGSFPALTPFVQKNKFGDESINFSSAEAVIALNQAIIKHDYGIENWEVPQGYLSPPIPGRADYVHHIADLLAKGNEGAVPSTIHCLDIGTGASAIYPLIAQKSYNWTCVGSDIDPVSIASAQKIVETNALGDKIEIRTQSSQGHFFEGIWGADEKFDITICNPPFHATQAEAEAGNLRKLRNLKKQKIKTVALNFGGQKNELCCEGGEKKFVRDMIAESKQFGKNCFAFSSLVSREANLPLIYAALEEAKALAVQTLDMGQGNKKSRIVVWTFLSTTEQATWAKERWSN